VVYILTLFSRSYEVLGGAVVLLLFESAVAFLVFSAVFTYLKKLILASISILSLFFLYFLCFREPGFVPILIHILAIHTLAVGGPLLLMLAVDLFIERALKPKLKGT
jgi:hypothetical protein